MTRTTSRRLFLRGAGGVSLGLPFLPSLMSSTAFGQDMMPRRLPRFVSFTTPHGAVLETSMFPPESELTETVPYVAGHEMHRGALVRKVTGAEAALSPVLRAPADQLTDRIVSKINVLRGLDVPFYLGHHTGGALGNYARNDGNGSDGKQVQAFPMPTIDQLMGWSPSFYKSLGGIRERVVVTGNGGFSWFYSDPAGRAGSIQEQRTVLSSRQLFDKLFLPPTSPTMPPPAMRTSLVDRVLEDYKRLRASDRRLSMGDRRRLDDHLSRLSEIDRRITDAAMAVPTASCGGVARVVQEASGMVDRARAYQLYNDVVVAAFLCGTSRVATIGAYEAFVPIPDLHGAAHSSNLPGSQKLLFDTTNAFFRSVFLDLVRKLDVEESPGVTVLDNSLVAWAQESGMRTHESVSIPVITAGSAAGWMKTGQYCDYRNYTKEYRAAEPPYLKYGVTFNQWLGTALTAMGVPRSEYGKQGMTGYGHPFIAPPFTGGYVNGVIAKADDPLPFLKA